MLRIAFWTQNQLSYQRSEEAIRQILLLDVGRVTIRNVTNYMGISQTVLIALTIWSISREGFLSGAVLLKALIKPYFRIVWKEQACGGTYSWPKLC